MGGIMSAFNSKDELVDVLSALWDEIFNTPAIMEKISAEKLIVKFRFTDFGTDFYVDNKGDAPRYYWDPPDDVDFDVEMIQTSDTSHQFWLQKLKVPTAIATRKVIAKGSVQKALKLIPALKPAFALYPMDNKTILDSVAKTGYLATIEEDTFSGSVGSEIISRTAVAAFDVLKGAPLKIAAPENPIPYAKNLENAMLPTAETAAQTIERTLNK
jgi:hypothetical protein